MVISIFYNSNLALALWDSYIDFTQRMNCKNQANIRPMLSPSDYIETYGHTFICYVSFLEDRTLM